MHVRLCFYGFIGALLAACMMKIYTLTGERRKGPYSPLETPNQKNLPVPLKTKKL
jgi:hypothetical protein